MATGRNTAMHVAAVCAAAMVFLCGCSHEVPPAAADADELVVCTTFYPTQYFAERIGGELVQVICPVPEDEDAIFWMPDDETIQQYQQADLIVLNGAGFAKWVEKVSLPQSRVIDTAASFEDEFIHYENATVHRHGMAGDHAHEGLDGHTWVDPVHAMAQAKAVKEALVARLPESQTEIEQGYAGLIADLQSLDETLRAYAEKYDGKPFFASHPAYNYIAQRYGWNVINLDLDPGEMPSEENFATMQKQVAAHGIQYLLWEGQPTEEIAARIQTELGIRNIVFSPCELISKSDQENGVDYIQVMTKNLDNIAPIFMSAE
jgi:zinc transport system substrate-binding protein